MLFIFYFCFILNDLYEKIPHLILLLSVNHLLLTLSELNKNI